MKDHAEELYNDATTLIPHFEKKEWYEAAHALGDFSRWVFFVEYELSDLTDDDIVIKAG